MSSQDDPKHVYKILNMSEGNHSQEHECCFMIQSNENDHFMTKRGVVGQWKFIGSKTIGW